MHFASPPALADLLRRDKDALLSAWEARAKRLPGAEQLPSAYLRDHIPELLEELAVELERPESARERVKSFSAAHGEQRHKIGLNVQQVVEEYKLMRRCIFEHAEAHGLAAAGAARQIVNGLIDDGIKTAIETYIERRDAAEKQRREEYLKFVVHDLRSPLTAIYYAILLAERELQDTDVGERVRSIHAAIKRNIEQMRSLIVKLLQEEQNIRTPRHVEVQRDTVVLRPVVEAAVHTLDPLATTSATQVRNEVPPELAVHADGGLLERIFQNLIANAIEHTPNGRVTIGAAPAGHDGVDCWIADNGGGVPEHIRAQVFDKFVTDSQRRSGIGLGLAVVKQLVEAHGGNIELASEAGKGTTVRFSIPGG